MVKAEGPLAHVQPIDEAAFLLQVQPLLPIAQRLAHGMLRSPTEAEDIVQEATLNAWTKIHSFQVGGDFKSWYLTIVANECRQTLRSAWWREIRKPFLERGSSPPPQDRVAASDEVRRALDRLSYDHRLVIVLRFYPNTEVTATAGRAPAALARDFGSPEANAPWRWAQNRTVASSTCSDQFRQL